jgi:hypothetical protein
LFGGRFMKRPDAVFSREEFSPDGALCIWYNYMDGEKTPTVIEPCVTLLSTGEVLVDFWRLGLNGSVSDFTADTFTLTVTDSYGLAKIVARVEVSSRTFTLIDDATPARPLAVLRETLFWIVDRARESHASPATRPATTETSLFSKFTRWLRG